MSNTLSHRVAQARTLLFVPGNRPERFEKAARSGADAVVLDLEDSVPVASKPDARQAIECEWPRLQTFGVPLVVRVNAIETAAGQQDLDFLRRMASLEAVMLPRIESAETITFVHRRLSDVPVIPIIESAAGYAVLPMLAQAPGLMRVVIGHLDFIVDTGMQCDEEQSELASLRFAVAIATRLNGLAPAVDGVTEQIDDEQKLRADVRRAIRFGFAGKLCIHPVQVGIVHDAMTPTEQELAWARRVVAADAMANGAAVQVEGRMVDRPVVLRARQIIARSSERFVRSQCE